MDVLEKSKLLMKDGYICDHCLGRQFAQLTKGTTNALRGKSIRDVFAFAADAGIEQKVYPLNFYSYNFRNAAHKKGKIVPVCRICGNFFEKLMAIAGAAIGKISKFEYNSFVVGSKISGELARREEELWEEVGTDYCEPIKAEINREIGKLLEKKLNKKADFENPDILVLVDTENGGIDIRPSQLWIYGLYQKLVRGMPQTKWPCRNCRGEGCEHCHGKGRMYKTSVEEIIAKHLINSSRSSGSSFHGAGREDIDARCLGWRPFVMELMSPFKRNLNLGMLQKEINKGSKVKVKLVKFCNKDTARKIKAARLTKTYRIAVNFKKPITKGDIKKILGIRNLVKQRTPQRVSHRRADLVRERRILGISGRLISQKSAEFVIKTEAGMYVKELVTGDNGRTEPSFSGITNNEAAVKALDVIAIGKIKV